MNLISTHKTWILGSIILCLDAATTANVFTFFKYFEPPLFAGLVALSFILLQVGTLVLFAQPLPESIRRWLFVGATILLCMTGLSNVAISYLHSRTIFPAADLLPALGIGDMDAGTLGVLAAWCAGIALVAVGLIFWTALGTFVRDESERQRSIESQLEEIFKTRTGSQ